MTESIVLALGGGGVKGIAHLGIVACLLENHYSIEGIAGTSAGGMFGAPLAAQVPPREILDRCIEFMKKPDFRRVPKDTASLVGTRGLEIALAPFLEGKVIDDLPIKFCVTAVSLKTGEEVVISEGDVMQAVLSTIAIPGVFPTRGEDVLVDGGVMDPVPIKPARALNPSLSIVAVTLHTKPADSNTEQTNLSMTGQIADTIIDRVTKTRIGESLDIMNKGVGLGSDRLTELSIEVGKPDVLVRPLVGQFSSLQKVDPTELYDEGYRAMESQLPALVESLTLLNSIKRIAKYSNANPK